MKHIVFEDNLSLENIERQPANFYNELVMESTKLLNLYRDDPEKFTLDKFAIISATIRKYTGINVQMSVIHREERLQPGDFNYAISILESPNINNALFDSATKKALASKSSQRKVNRLLERGLEGTIDIKNNKVTGDFTNIPFELIVSTSPLLQEFLTPEEFTAIILHEVGHAFTLLYTVDQVVATNQIMHQLFGNLVNSNDVKNKTLAVRYAYEDLGITPSSNIVESIVSKDPEEAMEIFLADTIQSSRSISRNGRYNSVSIEVTADQYSVRCGAGPTLASANEKAERLFSGKTYVKNKLEFMEAEANRAALLATQKSERFYYKLWGAVAIGSTLVGAIPFTIIGIIASNSHYKGYMSAKKQIEKEASSVMAFSDRYDHPRDRIQRIRNDLVNQLKLKNKDNAYYKAILADIKGVDQVLSNYYHEESLLVKVFELPEKMDDRKLQQELEKLAANELFVKSAQFKHM